MFRRRSQTPRDRKISTIIGKDTTINGQIEVGGSIRIDGCLNGDVRADGDVTVGDSGKLKASIYAANVAISGEIEGDIYAGNRLEIASTGKLCGNIKAATIHIEDGAVFRGLCEMLTDLEPPKLLPGEVYDEVSQGNTAGGNE
jgi:cytoskeletal protein CcmA (bactofilin family)